MPAHGAVGHVAVLVQVHVAGGRQGRLLAVILREDGAVGEADHHEPAASQVPGLRVHDGEGQPGGDGRVYGVATGRENLHPDARRVLIGRGDHAFGGPDGEIFGGEGPLLREGAARLDEGAGRGAGRAARGAGLRGARLAAADDEEQEREGCTERKQRAVV